MKVFGDNNIGDKYHKENIEAAADQQSPSAARRLARLVGFVLGAEGRRSSKTEMWQHSRRPLFCPPAGLARQGVASSVGLVVRVSTRDEERESMTEKEEGRVYVHVYASVCDRAALRGKRRAMGGIVRAVDVGKMRGAGRM